MPNDPKQRRLDTKLEEVGELRQQNTVSIMKVSQHGPVTGMLQARFERFIEFMLPYDEGKNEDRLDFELDWEKWVAKDLQRFLSELEQQKDQAEDTHPRGGPQRPGTPPNGNKPGGLWVP